MAISRFKTSSVAQGLPKYQKFWDGSSSIIDFFGDGSTVHYYNLENTTDLKGGLTLTNLNSVAFNAGKVGNAADYSGGTRSLYNDSVTTLSGNGARSYSVWSYTNSGATDRQLIIGNGSFSNTQQNFDLEANVYHVGAVSDSYGVHWWGNGCKFDSATTLYNQWVHLVLVHDGGAGGVINASNTRLYVNGVAKTLNSAISSASPSPQFTIQSTSKLRIGTRYYPPSATDCIVNGKIDQVRIFNKALTQTEVNALYNGGAGN